MILKLKNEYELNILEASEYYRRDEQRFEFNLISNYSVAMIKNILFNNIDFMTLINENKEVIIEGYNKIFSIELEYNTIDLEQSNIRVVLTKE